MSHDGATASAAARNSWRPMIAIALTQVLMSFNVAALPVSLGGMVEDFGAAPTTVSTGIVMYGLAVAALVMLGAKLGQRFGWVVVFRGVLILFLLSTILMVTAPGVWFMIAAQGLAGASAAILVPALVALIAENYHGDQQATAVGSLGSARAASGISAFLIGGVLGTYIGWRPVWMLLAGLTILIFILSFSLRGDRGDRTVTIDGVGAILIGTSIMCLTLGFNNLNGWGVLAATDGAPFSLIGLSPAPVLILIGVVLGHGFLVWTRRRSAIGQVPLIDLRVIGTPKERAAIFAMFIIVALEAAVNFTIPLYIQIVQGRSALDTAFAMMPFNLTVFISALLVVRFYRKFSSRTIAQFSFCLTTIALVWLAIVVTNDWQTLPTILGLIAFGVGQGALVTLVFNVLVTSAPASLAGDVGSVRGTAQNLASAVGTAVSGALLVMLLSIGITQSIAVNGGLSDDLEARLEVADVNFIANDQLRDTLEDSNVAPADVDQAVQVNTEARLTALRTGLLVLAGISALAIIPSRRLPQRRHEEIPDPSPEDSSVAAGES
ncbi:MFS transporter [Arthrobacter castelli]|uniref:MFS transporter n=1 Tax=Arthrobacter castelli TaxID=271431 RepID=UPI0004097BED|nr:MFS transporter [Arthrobacter castelli]